MRRYYCSPMVESVCIETFILAASAAAARMGDISGAADEAGKDVGSWGDIWK